MKAGPRVLFLWPGGEGPVAGNFGVPQLVVMATYLRHHTSARITIRDMECERALGAISFPHLLHEDQQPYDIVAIGCYSSFDFLRCQALADIIRSILPSTTLVVGGYHVSACPEDFIFDGSTFDVAIVGEGEHAMRKVIQAVEVGQRPTGWTLDSDPLASLDELPPTDWTFLDRYRPFARQIAGQAQLYLSRGCPFDCAFCMERAKREVSWRAHSVERALDEVRRLHHWLDLRGWTVYFADALFGMRPSWRRAFLEGLAREAIPADKFWLLIRVDLVQDDDLELLAKANCAPGFGLESGDPSLLATIRKAGKLDDYLERMLHVAARAVELDLPWGANVICGHPGETEATLRTSAAYLRQLFLGPNGTTGFLSVDPFRLYPGSPLAREQHAWEARFGTRFYRPRWWHDGDPEFLAEWVDPSAELTYRRRATLQHELLSPILDAIPSRFVYKGPARRYFERAMEDQASLNAASSRFHFIERYYAWNRYLGRSRAARSERLLDTELADTARDLRRPGIEQALERAELLPAFKSRMLDALETVGRERFVPLDALRVSLLDEPVLLDKEGMSTVSAMHAYVLSFALLDVQPGDQVLDLGAGTGYGTALLGALVGKDGKVRGIELDPMLVEHGQPALRAWPQVSLHAGNAMDPTSWGGPWFHKITVGFALPSAVLNAWFEDVPLRTIVVAPLVRGTHQVLVRAVRLANRWDITEHTPVMYVQARTEVAQHGENHRCTPKLPDKPRRLPVVTP